MSINDDLMIAAQRLGQAAVFLPSVPTMPEWVEVQPVRVAVNRITGDRVFLDPADGMWRYLPSKEPA